MSKLFPLPKSHRYVNPADRQVDDESVYFWGYCAPYCHVNNDFVLPTQGNGNTVDEHCGEPFCVGDFGSAVECINEDLKERYVAMYRIRSYMHGEYDRADSGHGAYGLARLQVDDGNGNVDADVYLTSGSLRSLAANLVALADVMDGLT